MIRLASAAALALALAATAVHGKPRTARCELRSAGERLWNGPCLFTAEHGGSFSVAPVGKARFPGGISSISVDMAGGGTAEVRGLTHDGINSRWGEARRSRKDPACWEGPDFRVCAR